MHLIRATARKTPSQVDVDELVDSDVPAAVVCAHCGEAECPGCLREDLRSGVVALVAWERSGTPALARLWATARATTFDAETFFELLPDGPVAPALRFAVVSELIASAAMSLMALVPIGFAAPSWAKHVVFDESGTAARLAVIVVPGLAFLLVLAHMAHGWALGWGARRTGAARATRQSIRFGLYAAGWDLVIGPVGAVVMAFKEGLGPALSIAGVGMGIPARSARAFLRGCYRLEGKSAEPALRASNVAAVLATIVGAIAVVAALVALLFL